MNIIITKRNPSKEGVELKILEEEICYRKCGHGKKDCRKHYIISLIVDGLSITIIFIFYSRKGGETCGTAS
ncbi:MAG: hypothetical protein WDA59_00185 [Methanofastidiosum sp.]|jgi:hypothetical protein